MSGERDPWVLLGVQRSADDKDIKKAYRSLARQHHPDRNPNDKAAAAMFQDIARAYEAIETQAKRDAWLSEHEDRTATSGASPFLGPEFYDTFGAGSGPAATPQDSGPFVTNESRAQQAARDIRETLVISFLEAFTGTNIDVQLDVEEACATCGGSGSAPGHRPRPCPVCRGAGEHVAGRVVTKCAACQGRGYTVQFPCRTCVGAGSIQSTRPFVCPIPPGVIDGQVLRLPGPSHGRIAAPDVLITVKVKPSLVFHRNLRDPADLLVEVPVSYTEAVLGCEVKIPTPEKAIQLRVPPGTMSGKAFRIPGKGMPRLENSSEHGNLYARVNVLVPKKLSSPQRKLIQQLGHYDNDDLRASMFAPGS